MNEDTSAARFAATIRELEDQIRRCDAMKLALPANAPSSVEARELLDALSEPAEHRSRAEHLPPLTLRA